MKRAKAIAEKGLSITLSFILAVFTLCSCSVDNRHLEITEQDNPNSNIQTWDEAEIAPGSLTWDTVGINSWEEVDDLTNPIYSTFLFNDYFVGYPEIEAAVIDFRSDGQYFEGEKVYELVGNKFDLNKLIGDVAIGTTVIVVCVLINAGTGGTGTPIAVFFAGAAKNSVALAKIGAVLGAAAGSVSNYIESDADWERTLFGTLEGAAEGFKWGAIFGAIDGGVSNYLEDAAKSTTKFFPDGSPQAAKYPNGIRFSSNGYPRFEPYKIAEAKFPMPTREGVMRGTCLSGNYARDAKLANAACGFPSTPKGYVWHHVEDMMTLILVPQDLHSPAFHGMAHPGGASLIKKLLGI